MEASGGSQEAIGRHLAPRGHRGDTQEARRNHPGGFQEDPGAPMRHAGRFQEAPRRHSGSAQRYPEGTQSLPGGSQWTRGGFEIKCAKTMLLLFRNRRDPPILAENGEGDAHNLRSLRTRIGRCAAHEEPTDHPPVSKESRENPVPEVGVVWGISVYIIIYIYIYMESVYTAIKQSSKAVAFTILCSWYMSNAALK